MEKDETEKRKLFISQGAHNKDNSDNEIKVASSIYRIKNKENIDINNNEQNIDKMSVKKIYNSEDKNTELNNDKNREIMKYTKQNSRHNSRQNSHDSKYKRIQNIRYEFLDNDDLSEKYEEFSERNQPKEKPNKINYKQIKEYDEKQDNVNDNLEQAFRSNEMKKDILRSSNHNIHFSYLQEQNPQSNYDLQSNKKNKKNNDFSKYYLSSKKFVEKSKLFIVLFSIGIVLSSISLIFCIFLQLYGNQDVYIIFSVISLILIILYILAIKFILQDRKKILSIIKKVEDPEKIFHSKSRKNLLLIIYILLIAFNYHHVVMLVNTCFLNNIKLSIRGKGYDINQWIELFSRKNYNEILKTFEKVNIAFLFFSWLNEVILIIIIIIKIVFLFSYRLMKSIIQVSCILALQGGILQIYLSLYCYKFRDVTSLEGIRVSWATPGTMSNGCVAIFIGIFGFYAFYMEDKKKIAICQIICICQIFLLLIFNGGLSAISDKFYNYKHATCNSLFKFISEDYLLKNKLSGCTSKYIFNSETLDNMQCPKDRIMINWELTEKLEENDNLNDRDIIINEVDSNREESDNIHFGCINQSCCLQVYFDIKNKFDFLLILGIHLIIFFAFFLFLGFYIQYKLKSNCEIEEISEKKNFLFIGILTICIYIFVFPFIFSLPKSSNQSILNKIKNNEVSDSLSIIQNNLIRIEKDNLFKYTNESFNTVKQEIVNNFKYNIMFDYKNKDDNEYTLSYYEYIITSSDLDIIADNTKLNQISYSFSNSIKKLIFKSELNIINEFFNYIDIVPYNPLKNCLLLNVEINGIFIKNKNNNENNNDNNINNKYNNIIITKEILDKNYDENNNNSLISIIQKNLDFSIMNKDELFYLKGQIINDNGNSIINIYNYDYNNAPIYSIKSNDNGSFIIGPLYRLLNDNAIYYLNIEISKITYKSEGKFIEDENYCKYYDRIKISKFGFHFNKYYSLNSIFLSEYKEGSMDIVGNIIEYDKIDDPISDVYVKLFYDNQINVVKEKIENNQDSINTNFLDDICISKTITNKKGRFSLNINKSGQYMIVFIKGQYYLENHIFTIKNISSNEQFDIGTVQLISLFNSGKIIVKLEWDNKPPDLDLICRFQVSKDHYCYTFFGNKKCVETEFFKDSRELKEISSEIIEISEFSEYVYLFYVRKYFDNTNGYTKNEKKIEGVETNSKINYTDISIKYNETLDNSIARLLIYTNGYKMPALKISIPGYIENKQNKTENQTEYNYWIAFCINGKEGINSLKVLNEFSQNSPPKNICLSYYDQSNLITF